MRDDCRILCVDDEETFLRSTVDLLRREGYPCDAASDVATAIALAEDHDYDLVIADIKMPGNADLEFVHRLALRGDGLSVILVTGYPSVASAARSVELPVVAYLVKPFDFEQLLQKIRIVARRAEVRRAVRDELARVREYRRGLARIEADLSEQRRDGYTSSLNTLVGVTLRNIVDGLCQLHRMIERTQAAEIQGECAHWAPVHEGQWREALHDAVATLERTRGSFKSKELGNLRKRLEELLKA
jgi:CheY-like chemotaxis protein